MQQSDVVDLLSTILSSSYATPVVREYILTALMKLTTRLTEAAQIERVRRTLQQYSGDLDVEIQQRAVEYGNLFGYDQVRAGVLEKMPAPEMRETDTVMRATAQKAKGPAKKKAVGAGAGLIEDLIGGDDVTTSTPVNGSNGQSNLDLIADIFGDTPASPPPAPAQQKSNISSIMDLFGAPPPSTGPSAATTTAASGMGTLLGDFGGLGGVSAALLSQPQVPTGPKPIPVYNKNDLDISIQLQRNADGLVNVLVKFRNTGFSEPISGVNLQAAVPKSQKLQLQPISSAVLEVGGEATQAMRVAGSKVVCSSP